MKNPIENNFLKTKSFEKVKNKRPKIAIVYSEFNNQITENMLQVALNFSEKLGLEVVEVLKVPGAFEIPFGCEIILQNKNIDGVVTLGAVIKGETMHDEVIMNAVCNKILDLQEKFKKPIGLGISGPGQTQKQAKERIKDYAMRSVKAVFDMLNLKRR